MWSCGLHTHRPRVREADAQHSLSGPVMSSDSSLLMSACDRCDDDASLLGGAQERRKPRRSSIFRSCIVTCHKVNKAPKRPTTLIFSALF